MVGMRMGFLLFLSSFVRICVIIWSVIWRRRFSHCTRFFVYATT